jgi:hypothetical protein
MSEPGEVEWPDEQTEQVYAIASSLQRFAIDGIACAAVYSAQIHREPSANFSAKVIAANVTIRQQKAMSNGFVQRLR